MSKLFRSALWAGLVAVGVAACGDDVTIPSPPITVSVAPNGVPLAVGATLQMTATVNAPAGTATTVTWSTSDATKATVNATGLVTGVAAGSVAITACSTAQTNACGSATITVGALTPASISIASITNTVCSVGGVCSEVPVVLNNVAGQIQVHLNLDAGNQIVSSVEVLVDNVVACSQAFSLSQWQAAQAAAAAADSAMANDVVPIVCSFNTGAFNATTGVPNFFNGPRSITARVNLVGSAPVATPSIGLVFNNVSFIAITTTVINGGSANSVTGILWQTGDLKAVALPVIYTPGTPVIQQIVLTPTGCGLASVTLTGPPFVAIWAKADAIGDGGSDQCEFAGMVVLANSTVGGAVGPVGASIALNFDNKGPGAPTFVANPNNRQNGWINASVGLVGVNSGATDNDWMINGAADGGVGGYVRFLRIGAGGVGATIAAANAATASSAPALAAPSVDNVSYCGVATAKDLLGNETPLDANGTTCLSPPFASFVATGSSNLEFGVDINAPTIAFSGGLASNARINAATVGGEFQVTVADVGLIGNSGMLGGAPVIGNLQTRNAAGTVCGGVGLPGALVSGVCTNNSTGIGGALPLQATTGVAVQPVPPGPGAYYTFTALAQDAAGNQSATVTRVVVRDNTPVAVTNPAIPLSITGAFTASAFLNDDLSIRDYFWTAGYTTGLLSVTTLTLASAPTVVDAFNAPVLTNINFAINTPINTFLGLQGSPGNVPAAYVAGSNPLSSVNLFARDQTQPAYTGGSSPVAPTAPAAGIDISSVTPAWTFNTYTPATSNATICAGQAGAPACGVIPTSTTLSVTASGTTATFPNPFSRVDFYAVNAAGTNLVLVGSVPAGSATLVDNGATRVFTYALPVTALSFYTTLGGTVPGVIGPVNVYAFGVNAAGNVALVSTAVAQTINP